MFTVNKYLLTGLLVFIGEIALTAPSFADDTVEPPLLHDTGTVSTNQSQVDTGVATSVVGGSLNSDTGIFTVEGLGGGNEVTIPPDVIQSVDDLTGVSGTDSNNITTANPDSLNTGSSETITICLSEPCVPSGESTKAISLNDLAKLMEDDLQNSLNDLAATERLQRRATSQPRRFVRRKPANCVNPAIQAREELENKLAESRKFVEQVEKLNPDNNIW